MLTGMYQPIMDGCRCLTIVSLNSVNDRSDLHEVGSGTSDDIYCHDLKLKVVVGLRIKVDYYNWLMENGV